MQTVEEIYALVRSAVIKKRPISADYHGHFRLMCPHRIGHNTRGEPRVLCYQYGGKSERGLKPIGSPENWRCIAVDQLSRVAIVAGSWKTASNHSRPQSCVAIVDVDAEDVR